MAIRAIIVLTANRRIRWNMAEFSPSQLGGIAQVALTGGISDSNIW